jgi:hypothetical protein
VWWNANVGQSRHYINCMAIRMLVGICRASGEYLQAPLQVICADDEGNHVLLLVIASLAATAHTTPVNMS